MRALALSLLLALAAPAWAATWFVDCSATVNGAGSFASPYNTTASLNWTTIDSTDDDVLFKEGTTCNNTQLGGASGFPNATNRNGSAGDRIVIGVYDSASGARVACPPVSRRVSFTGDGTTRSDMVSLFGFTYTDLDGFTVSGGSNSFQRGMVSIGANGVTVSSYVTVSCSSVTQGNTPTNTGAMIGFRANGTSTGATGTDITFDRVSVSGLVGTSDAHGVQCTNVDRCSVTNSVIDASTFTAPTTIGVLHQSSTDARAVTTGATVTGNTITGGKYGWRYAPFGTSAAYPYINSANVSNNTFASQTVQGIYAALLKASAVDSNTVQNAGRGTGAGSGMYFAGGVAGLVGSSDMDRTSISRNVVTDSGQFGIWIVGASNFSLLSNTVTNAGTTTLANTYGRAIELSTNGSPTYPAQGLTLSATSGTSIAVTAAGSVFAATDVEKTILGPVDNAGMCRITAFSSATSVTCSTVVPFSNTSLSSGFWRMGLFTHTCRIGGLGFVSGAKGQQYLTAPGTEGVGIGLDDGTSNCIIESQAVWDNEFAGISLSGGAGNVIRGNALWNNGIDPTASLPTTSVRRSNIDLGYVGAEVTNNSVDCARTGTYGIVAENSTTVSPTTPAAGGISNFRNNAIINCSRGALIGNSNDLASNNSYFANGANYQWMAQLSFSNSPAGGDLTTQALDGASITADPKLAAGTTASSAAGFCLESDSPLLAAGTYLGAWATGYAGHDLGKPPAIGARGLCRDRQPAATRPSVW